MDDFGLTKVDKFSKIETNQGVFKKDYIVKGSRKSENEI